MIQVRPMNEADVPLGMRLKTQAGWNQTEADWRRFLQLGGEGCFVGEWDGQAVATATTCIFGSVGWIAMVLVESEFRHRGIATRLVQQAVEFFDRRGLATARLDATALGRPVYERLGFVAEYELVRLEGGAAASPDAADRLPCVAASLEHLDAIAALDQRATGTSRRRLLAQLLAEYPQRCWIFGAPAALDGYVMTRGGTRAGQIGPAAAISAAAGCRLLDQALLTRTECPVFVDVPCDNSAAMAWARQRGLAVQRSFIRMVRGRRVADRVDLLWASSGPEKG